MDEPTETLCNLYPYKASSTNRYILKRDGSEVLRGTESDVWGYIHKTHCYSVDHALTHEGYAICPEEELSC